MQLSFYILLWLPLWRVITVLIINQHQETRKGEYVFNVEIPVNRSDCFRDPLFMMKELCNILTLMYEKYLFLWIKINSAHAVTGYVQLNNDNRIKHEILITSSTSKNTTDRTIAHGMSINFSEGSWRTTLQIINRISMQVRLMQFSCFVWLHKTIDVIAVTWKDVLVVFDKLQLKGSKKD